MLLLLKTHVDGYTKKDGTYVAPHEDKRSTRTLYHGSRVHVPKIRSDRGIFGGVFASGSREAAASHGDIVHQIDLPDDAIMTQAQMVDVSDDDLKKVARWVDDADLDRLRELVVDEAVVEDDDLRILKEDDLSEASWEAQRLRGALAKLKGFKAVEMSDEHGTSYLVLPGAPISKEGGQPAWGDPSVVDEIKDEIEDDPHADWGLRVIPHDHEVDVDAELPPSNRWEGGEMTDEELDGTSAIGIRGAGDIGRAIKILNAAGYQGAQVALVRGESQGSGEDPGEVVLRDAVVVRVWQKPGRQMAKAHPTIQGMTSGAKVENLTEPGLRRSPGEPDAGQAASGEYRKPRIPWRGLTLAIENPAGSVRRGRNRAGVTWEVRMRYDYGEIVGTMGVDGDPVDVIVGPNPDAPMVYVVHQRRYNDWANYDEDKCCVGFDSEDDAKAAFLSNYNDPRFLGPVTAMPADEFVAKVRATKDKPAMIKAAAPIVLFLKSRVGAYLRGGKLVNLAGYEGRTARAVASPGQMALFMEPPADARDAGPAPVVEPRDEMIQEHKRLVRVLNSPSHEDDKAEAKKQAAELKEYEAGEHDRLLSDLPGAKWRRGHGLIDGHYGVEIGGEVLGNYHARPEDAVAAARRELSVRDESARRKAERASRIAGLRQRLGSGGEATDADLFMLGLRAGSSGLPWFIPAAAEVFGIASRAVRPHIKDLIRVGRTDMGAKREFVDPRRALRAVADGLADTQKA